MTVRLLTDHQAQRHPFLTGLNVTINVTVDSHALSSRRTQGSSGGGRLTTITVSEWQSRARFQTGLGCHSGEETRGRGPSRSVQLRFLQPLIRILRPGTYRAWSHFHT